MPEYLIRDPKTSRTLRIRGDSPPTAAELEQLFANAGPSLPEAATRGMMPQSTPQTTTETPYETPREREQRLTNEAMAYAPAVGGMLGGTLGGIPGAALGGGAGRAVQQLSAGESLDPRAIGIEGAIQGGAQALGVGVTKAAGAAAKGVYRGFLKPSISQRLAPRADQIVQTALDEALPITRGGAAKGQRIIGELRQEVDDILAQSKGTVDLKAVATKVRAFAKQKYYKPGADLSDYKAALAVADRLDAHPSLGIPPGVTPTRVSVPAKAANEAKRALDASVGDTGFGVKTGAQRTTEKFARSQMRRGLEQVEPSIAPLNARESKLIDAARAVYQGAQREANRNQFFGVPSLMAGALGGGGYALSGDPASAAAVALATRVGMHPAVASRVAITAYRLSTEMGIAASTAARLAVVVASEDDASE